MFHRTHSCGKLRAGDVGKAATLIGWVHRRRTFGGLTFIDLRDRHGITQLVFNPTISPEAHAIADDCRPEFVLAARGVVEHRPEGTVNANLPTGEIDVLVQTAEILNTAKTPPFEINQDADVDETLRMKYRYLDLRRERQRDIIVLRHQVMRCVRAYLDERDFVEIETPNLVNRTPGGAREFLVP